MTNVNDNLQCILARMDKTCQDWGRAAQDVRLVAVSKGQQPAALAAALAAGQRVFGENRVQEAREHWAELRTHYPDLRLHMIGALQTNKVHEAVALFDVLETVDRPSLAEALVKEMKQQGRVLPCFVQANTGGEEQKSGVPLDKLGELLAYCQEIGLEISGLMCIPPQQEPAGLHFALLRKLADRYGLSHLSMGMSADYPTAIQAGATFVRVGTALFGDRQYL